MCSVYNTCFVEVFVLVLDWFVVSQFFTCFLPHGLWNILSQVSNKPCIGTQNPCSYLAQVEAIAYNWTIFSESQTLWNG